MDRQPTLQELANAAANASGGAPVCPGCGRRLFAYGVQALRTRIIRYEECRTPGCERRFKTRQWQREIIEEIKPRLSIAGNGAL